MHHFKPVHAAWFILLCLAIDSALAEHRVALLLGNPEHAENKDLDAVVQSLGQYGFTCRHVKGLANENAFRDAIEGFVDKTPTNSTCLIYYQGQLGGGKLLGTDGRGSYTLERLFEALRERGASRRNLVFIDGQNNGEDEPSFKGEVPGTTALVFGTTKTLLGKLDGKTDALSAFTSVGESTSTLPQGETLTGRGSEAISPRDKFVTGNKAGDEWVNSLGVVFCWCPSGKYIAGSPESVPGRYPDEKQREVVLEDGFWLSKYELTLSQVVAGRKAGRGTIARHKLHPATMINHDDARGMTRNFTASERQAGRLPADWEYTLPTEEQWEYAARAGTTTPFYFGDDIRELPSHANFADKSYYDSGDVFSNAAHRSLNDGAVKLTHVGSYQPNPWGFHDMYGNVAEWCINQAIRGGSWVSVAENCRSAYRDSFSSRNEQNFIGYRLVIQKATANSKK